MADDILTYANAERAARDNLALAHKHRRAIEGAPGGLDAYVKGIRVQALGAADDGQPFYDVLASGILPDELVPLQDFRTAIGKKNNDLAFQKAIGPYRYFGLALIDPSGKTVGAIGCEVFCHKAGPATVHSSYYALLPEVRSHGLMQKILGTTAETAVRYVAEARPEALEAGYILNIIESNDIAKLALGGRLLDEAMALHPIKRDETFDHKYGFREITGVDYHQRYDPPISLALKALRFDVAKINGIYRVTGFSPPKNVSSGLVRAHVGGFDNLLMNYDEARERIASKQPLADPVAEGLVKLPNEEVVLPVRSLAEGDAHRQRWSANDNAIKTIYADRPLPLDKTMSELATEHAAEISALQSPSSAKNEIYLSSAVSPEQFEKLRILDRAIRDAHEDPDRLRRAQAALARYCEPKHSGINSRLREFRELLVQGIPDPSEAEPFSGIAALATRTAFDPEIDKKVGKYREYFDLARDKAGQVIGIANYIVYLNDAEMAKKSQTAFSIQINYVVTREGSRSQELNEKLFNNVAKTAYDFSNAQQPEITA